MAKELKKVHDADALMALLEEHAGEGVSRERADNLVPNIIIAQPLSPFVTDGRAKAGDFWFPTTGRAVSGTEGIIFQPCAHDNMWMEFRPRPEGGGFVRTYPWLGFRDDEKGAPILTEEVKQIQSWPPVLRSADGGEVSNNRVWAGIYWEHGDGTEYVIKFTSTGHTTARNWNFAALSANKLASGKPRPLWGQLYKLTTFVKRAQGYSWNMLNVGPPIPLEKAEEFVGDPARAFALGETLHDSFAKKEQSAAIDEGERLDPEAI